MTRQRRQLCHADVGDSSLARSETTAVRSSFDRLGFYERKAGAARDTISSVTLMEAFSSWLAQKRLRYAPPSNGRVSTNARQVLPATPSALSRSWRLSHPGQKLRYAARFLDLGIPNDNSLSPASGAGSCFGIFFFRELKLLCRCDSSRTTADALCDNGCRFYGHSQTR